MVGSPLRYPSRGDSAWKTLLIGGVLMALDGLVVPTVFRMGYVVRVLRGTAQGVETPPEWTDWRRLGVEGLKAFAVLLAYVLLTASIALEIFGPDASVELLGTLFGGPLSLVVGLLTGALESSAPELASLVVLYFLSQYVTPAALANHAEHGTLRAGFAFGTLRPILGSWTYATGWVGYQAVSLFSLGLALLLLVTLGPLLGGLVAAFTSFYLWVVQFTIIGRTWAKVRSEESTESSDGPSVGDET